MSFTTAIGYLQTLDLVDMSADLATDARWLAKMSAFFKQHDLNNDGFLTLEEILDFHVKRQAEQTGASKEITHNLTVAVTMFFSAAGFRPGKKITIDEFVEGCSKLAKEENMSRAKGEKLLIEYWTDAFFDLVDLNKDGGISQEELDALFVNCGVLDPGTSRSTFETCDIDKDGKITREEFALKNYLFWCTAEDKSIANLYGDNLQFC